MLTYRSTIPFKGQITFGFQRTMVPQSYSTKHTGREWIAEEGCGLERGGKRDSMCVSRDRGNFLSQLTSVRWSYQHRADGSIPTGL